jgi:hypothetical protein
MLTSSHEYIPLFQMSPPGAGSRESPSAPFNFEARGMEPEVKGRSLFPIAYCPGPVAYYRPCSSAQSVARETESLSYQRETNSAAYRSLAVKG